MKKKKIKILIRSQEDEITDIKRKINDYQTSIAIAKKSLDSLELEVLADNEKKAKLEKEKIEFKRIIDKVIWKSEELQRSQNDLNVYTAGFFRFFLGFLLVFPYILKTKFSVYNTPNFKIHLIRSCLNLPAMLLGFAALAMIPFEKVSALHFVVPFFVTILAVIFFGLGS